MTSSSLELRAGILCSRFGENVETQHFVGVRAGHGSSFMSTRVQLKGMGCSILL